MTNLEIDISSDHSAFDNGGNIEIARILRALAESIESGKEGYFTLQDINGNKVGSAFFESWQ